MKLYRPKLRSLRWLALVALCALVVMYAAGTFGGPRVAPGEVRAEQRLAAPPASASAVKRLEPVFEEVFGTVRSRRTAAISSELAARVLAAPPAVGRSVKAGERLLELESSEFRAGLAEARAAQSAAGASIERCEQSKRESLAVLVRAAAERARVSSLFDQQAATSRELEAADSELARAQAAVDGAEASIATARAELTRAEQVVARAELALARTSIAAPFDAVIAERSVEVGELAAPGRVLCVLLDPDALRVEARVRESMLAHAVPSNSIEVRVDALDVALHGTIAEILPSGDPATRNFEVRVDLPDRTPARPGMFARLELAVGEREVVRVPARAVIRVGQLETIVARDGERWSRRLVTTGAKIGADEIEVLSGLAGGETVGVFGGDAR